MINCTEQRIKIVPIGTIKMCRMNVAIHKELYYNTYEKRKGASFVSSNLKYNFILDTNSWFVKYNCTD